MNRLLIISLAVSAIGCASTAPAPSTSAPAGGPIAPPKPTRAFSSGLAVERLFPLVDGHLLHYATTSVDSRVSTTPTRGMLLSRTVRSSTHRGQLVTGGVARHFEYRPDGVVSWSPKTGAEHFVVPWPVQAASQWPGAHRGTVSVTAMNQTVQVPAGTFSGCLSVAEVRQGDIPARFETTFCPGIGIVSLRAVSGSIEETAELVSHGKPVTMAPDGLDVVKP